MPAIESPWSVLRCIQGRPVGFGLMKSLSRLGESRAILRTFSGLWTCPKTSVRRLERSPATANLKIRSSPRGPAPESVSDSSFDFCWDGQTLVKACHFSFRRGKARRSSIRPCRPRCFNPGAAKRKGSISSSSSCPVPWMMFTGRA